MHAKKNMTYNIKYLMKNYLMKNYLSQFKHKKASYHSFLCALA